MISMVTFPSPTTTLSNIANWTVPFFDNFWPWLLIGLGILLAFKAIGWIVHIFHPRRTIKQSYTRYEDSSEGQYRKKHRMDAFD